MLGPAPLATESAARVSDKGRKFLSDNFWHTVLFALAVKMSIAFDLIDNRIV